MDTIIISAFPGCGKTYFYRNQSLLGYSVLDLDSGLFKRYSGWEKIYVDSIVQNMGKYDFILISQHDNILYELNERHINFFTVAPDNSKDFTCEQKQLFKSQWLKRLILRDNTHISNIQLWLKNIDRNYEIWTNAENIQQYNPIHHFAISTNQYLTDIIEDIIKYYKTYFI